ncbi:MAG: hypothetical protein K6U79_11550 [Firmicutes bacterium]|nr:hypothetical protein [Bacillota bacterium]
MDALRAWGEMLLPLAALGLVFLADAGVLWLIRRKWPGIEDRSFRGALRALWRVGLGQAKWMLLALGVVVGLAAGPLGWAGLFFAWRGRQRRKEMREVRALREELARQKGVDPS